MYIHDITFKFIIFSRDIFSHNLKLFAIKCHTDPSPPITTYQKYKALKQTSVNCTLIYHYDSFRSPVMKYDQSFFNDTPVGQI